MNSLGFEGSRYCILSFDTSLNDFNSVMFIHVKDQSHHHFENQLENPFLKFHHLRHWPKLALLCTTKPLIFLSEFP